MAMDDELIFFVNGKRIIDSKIDPEDTLLYYIRKNLYLTGTKLGCGEGGCGACTVMVSSFEQGEIVHRAVNACLAPIASVHLCAVTTIEGIGSTKNRLHAVQQSLVDSHGTQCGFCTPGIVMSMYTLVRNTRKPTTEMIERVLQGNLCRCTGYRPIIQGFKLFSADDPKQTEVVNKPQDCMMGEACCKKQKASCNEKETDKKVTRALDSDTQEPIFPPELKLVNRNRSLVIKGPRATWYRPTSLREIFELKAGNNNAKIVTGNTECCLEVKFRGLTYATQISPVAVPELNEIKFKEKHISIGAAVTLNCLDHVLRCWIEKEGSAPKTRIALAITEILKWFAGEQIRNVSAIGGNLMTASPISDLSQILMAAGAFVEFGSSSDNLRTVAVDENFFTSYRKTVIPGADLLVRINVPYCPETSYFFAYKQSKRKEDDIAIVNCAFLADFYPQSSTVREFRAAYGGMGPTTRLATKTNAYVTDKSWNQNTLNEITDLLSKEFDIPYDAPGGFAAYRKCLVTSLFFKFFSTVQHELVLKGFIEPDVVDYSAIMDIGRQETDLFQCHNIQSTDAVGSSVKHRSGYKQVTGEAEYLDDIPIMENEGYFVPLLSSEANAKIVNIDWSAALSLPGILGMLDYTDIMGENATSGCHGEPDDEFIRSTHVTSCGQIMGGIIAVNEKIARRAIKLVKVEYENISPVIITVEDAIKYKSYHKAPVLGHEMGDVEKGMKAATFTLESQVRSGGQEHFYFEANAIWCRPVDNSREMDVNISSQNLDMAQGEIARALGIKKHQVHARARRLGGGFGGKETRFHLLAGSVASAALKFNRPMRCMLSRDEDMMHTGTRHPFLTKYKVGYEASGKIIAADIRLYENAGYSLDLSLGVLSRAVDHCFNCYLFPNLDVKGYAMKTNLPSNTAFRGFGGPQGMFVAEDMVCKIADVLGKCVDDVRRINFLNTGDPLPYSKCGKNVLTDEHILHGVYAKCYKEFDMANARKQVAEFNSKNSFKKRGVDIVPTMFGIGFGLKKMNQGGALVHVYHDGSILVSHGGIEMGQGLYTKVIQIASKCFNVPIEKIHTSESSTTQVPNTFPSAASFSSDINGWAVKNACEKIMLRLQEIIARDPEQPWEDIIRTAHEERISLSASGFWMADCITWDPITRVGQRWNYYCYGAAASEVEIDVLTGEFSTRATHIVMDVGRSLNPAIDIGQIEGAFVQGLGLFTMEEQHYNLKGQLLTRGPGTYKIPGFRDIPSKFHVSLYDEWSNRHGLYHSKAVGEPPLFMGSSVFFAIRDAIKSVKLKNEVFNFNAPATVENIRMSVGDHLSVKAISSTQPTRPPWCKSP